MQNTLRQQARRAVRAPMVVAVPLNNAPAVRRMARFVRPSKHAVVVPPIVEQAPADRPHLADYIPAGDLARAIPFPPSPDAEPEEVRAQPLLPWARSQRMVPAIPLRRSAAFTESYPHGFLREPKAKPARDAKPGEATTAVAELKPELKDLFKQRHAAELNVHHLWQPTSVRTGVVGMKMGMMTMWDGHGLVMPITVVKVDHCQVTQVKPELSPKGRIGLQVGAGFRKLKNVRKSELAHFNKAGVFPKAKVVEFPITPDAVLPLGFHINVQHFKPGQYVDVAGITSGKGFQGGMKRHNFKGQPATHGVSVSHRSIGSVGQKQDPGRVWKGKRMPGHMGNVRATAINLQVVRIDTRRDLLFIKGAIPGQIGNWVMVRDAVKRPWHWSWPPPFPTYIHAPGEVVPDQITMKPIGPDPFAFSAGGAAEEEDPKAAGAAGKKPAAPAKKH